MEVFFKTIQSITSQNILGWFVIVIVIFTFIIGLVLSVLIKRYYVSLTTEILDCLNDEGEILFESQELNKMVSDFKKSAVNGTDNINTEVIIEKNLENKFIKFEGMINLLSSILTALGLLGTFLGLTLAIFDTKTALVGIENISNFTKELQGPIASMATAFWTSIFGVITSIILNLKNQSTKDARLNFYNEMENLLDNRVFAEHAVTFNTVFEEFSKTVKFTMLTLTEEMTNLFKNGVEELVTKINSSSLDLTESANGLKEYTKEFKGLVETFDNTVHSFEAPVESFNKSISNFVVVSSDLSTSVDEGFRKFVNSAENLDGSMIKLSSNIDSSFEAMSRTMDIALENLSANLGQCFGIVSNQFRDSMVEIGNGVDSGLTKISEAIKVNEEMTREVSESIMSESRSIIENQKAMKLIINEIRKYNEIQNKGNAYQVLMLNKHSKMLDESFKKFSSSIENISPYLAEKFSIALKQYLDGIGIQISDYLEDAIGNVTDDINQANKNLDDTISILESSSNLMRETTDIKNRLRGRKE